MFVSNGSLVGTKTPIMVGDSSWFPYMPGMSQPAGSAMWTTYGEIYKRHLWVYVVVNKRAAGLARLPLPVYQRDDLNRPRADSHPMARLLSAPNPGLSAFDLWVWTSSTEDIYGEAFWYKKRDAEGRVVSLWPLHPSAMAYEDGLWTFDNGALRIEGIRPTDLVHHRTYSPDAGGRGLSPLEPLRATLENEWSARSATSSFWRNGARPGVILSHPNRISQAAADRLKLQWDQVTAGAGNSGATVVLEEGMTPQVMQLTAEEAQYIETRKMNREEVCGAYDMPPPAVHILDRATFSNITEQMRSVYRDTQAPRCRKYEATIETDLRRVEWPDDDVYAEFLMDEVVRGDFETRQDALAKASHMTIAEKRKIENLPFIEGTDRIFLNTATLPLDAIDAQYAAAPPGEGVTRGLVRSVLGRLAWQSSLDDVVDADVVAGLPDASARAVGSAVSSERALGGTVKGLRARIKALEEAA